MQEARVSDIHFAGTTEGYNDLGRDYAKAFHGEDALVRPQLISEPMRLPLLFRKSRPGDEIPSPVGKPYDTF